jgi:O-antigen ligase
MAENLAGPSTTKTLIPMVLLLGSLSYAADAQGAFYPGPFHIVVVLVAVAVLASVILSRSAAWVQPVLKDPLVLLAGALIVVTVASSSVAGHPADATGTVSLLLAMVAAVAVVKSMAPAPRQLLVAGVVALAVIVALIGWLGVVARWQPEALTSQGLWRAASTLTYENALAAFLTAPALLCLDRLLTAPARSLNWSVAAFVLLLGIGSSLSRGGLLGLVVGIAVLGILRGFRPLLRLVPPVVGSLIAFACLAPSLPVASSRHVALSCVGLFSGAVTAAWSFGSRRLRTVAVMAAVVVLGVALALVSTGHVASAIVRARATASSSDRAHEWAAALAVAHHHLLLGVGTARVLLQWSVGGQMFTATFAHNEYLQLLTQDGVIGLGVLLVGLAGLFSRLARRRRAATAWSAHCGAACLVALLVQSSLDFLWHIPVIPLLMATVLALATTVTPTPTGAGKTVEESAMEGASTGGPERS